MTKEQIEQKAKNVYMRCFDDDFEYTDVLHALEICAEETATEATKELEAQIEKMSETLLDLLWFEDNLDPYMYECNDVQKGELLKPFDKARFYLEKYKCKKCKGEGTVKVGYNGWTTNPCPACEGKGYILRR